MKITYLGHSCIHLDTGKHQIIIDPFLTGNPLAGAAADEIKADYVLLTHGHSDHISDADSISRRNHAPIVAIVELANYFTHAGLQTIGMNLGGSIQLPFGKLKWVPALHSTSVTREDGVSLYFGVAAGIVLELGDLTLYHAGDTALFSDMKLIGSRRPIDLAFLPIGDHYTMGPEDALVAAEWVNAKHVVPVHYNTFELIRQDGQRFVSELQKIGIQGHFLKPAQTLNTETWN
ncbi:metal-dependent hydrolase [Paenibacillus sp. FSL R5-0527]|uniref:metal-dependent hydrolase n=1 Tax=Paenibacillus TaxID=44249 RepID=UPI00097AD51E|nr:metal-dependent hydrolase [Paenibacillus macerans]MED4956651.1 metal-dependent hydrolase [Paenibacillus macerans]OMG46110.1 metal-dependent hydrolase [Paenibacillus macerans]